MALDVAGAAHHAVLTLLAVCVQSFMLLQVCFFYLRLLWRQRGERGKSVAGAASNEAGTPAAALAAASLSCVVMVRNEEKSIRSTLRALSASAEYPDKLEVVVVDSGCTDGTMAAAQEEAKQLPISVAVTKSATAGRGAALDAGTAVATGGIIFVCHADCVVPRHFDSLIREGMVKPGVLATAFRFQLNREELKGMPLAGAAVMEFTVHLRSKVFQLPFGDQGLAISAAQLKAYGGWGGPAFPLMEDWQLVQKLRVDGARGLGRIEVVGTSERTLRCSPRRWQSLGVWRINLVNQLVMLWFQFGATPQQLFDFYYGISSDEVPRWLAVLTASLLSRKKA